MVSDGGEEADVYNMDGYNIGVGGACAATHNIHWMMDDNYR